MFRFPSVKLVASDVIQEWRPLRTLWPTSRPTRPARPVLPVRRSGATGRARSSTTADSLPNSPFLVMKRVAFGEPNLSTTNSRSLQLTRRRLELAGNGQYCGRAALSELAGVFVGLPPIPVPGPFRVRVSESQVGARLVNWRHLPPLAQTHDACRRRGSSTRHLRTAAEHSRGAPP